MIVKTGFSYSKTFFSRLVRLFTGQKYSHVFLSFNIEGTDLVFDADLKGVRASSWTGFNKENIIVEIFTLNVSDSTFNFCVKQLGKRYAFTAILAILLKAKFSDRNKTFICSEFVARALKMDFRNFDTVTPQEIREKLAILEGAKQ